MKVLEIEQVPPSQDLGIREGIKAELAALASSLADVAGTLSHADAEVEREVRPKLMAAVAQFHRSRFHLGRVLFEYRKAFKLDKTWLKVCEQIARALGLSMRTVHRVIEGYEQASTLPSTIVEALEAEAIDPAAKKNHQLIAKVIEMVPKDTEITKENAAKTIREVKVFYADPRRTHEALSSKERQVFQLRERIRKGLDSVPKAERLEVLCKALDEVLYYFLEVSEPTSLNLTPSPGVLGVDGRKRVNAIGSVQ